MRDICSSRRLWANRGWCWWWMAASVGLFHVLFKQQCVSKSVRFFPESFEAAAACTELLLFLFRVKRRELSCRYGGLCKRWCISLCVSGALLSGSTLVYYQENSALILKSVRTRRPWLSQSERCSAFRNFSIWSVFEFISVWWFKDGRLSRNSKTHHPCSGRRWQVEHILKYLSKLWMDGCW